MERLTYRPAKPYISKTSGELVKAYSDCSAREIINRLADYEDAEEQGRLIIINDTPRQVSPCDTCESGWGYSTTNGNYDSCFDVCEKLAEYRKEYGDD